MLVHQRVYIKLSPLGKSGESGHASAMLVPPSSKSVKHWGCHQLNYRKQHRNMDRMKLGTPNKKIPIKKREGKFEVSNHWILDDFGVPENFWSIFWSMSWMICLSYLVLSYSCYKHVNVWRLSAPSCTLARRKATMRSKSRSRQMRLRTKPHRMTHLTKLGQVPRR